MTTTPATATFAKTTQGIEDHLLNTVGVAPGAGQPQRPDAVGGPCRARTVVAPLGRDPSGRPHQQGAAGVLPVDGVPDGSHAGQRHRRARPARWRRCGLGAACPAAGGCGRPGGRCRSRQRRPGPARSVLPRLDGHARAAVVRLRHPLRVRHVRAGDRPRLPGGIPRPVAGRRHPVGVSARRRELPRALWRLGRTRGRQAPSGAMRPRWPRRPTTW